MGLFDKLLGGGLLGGIFDLASSVTSSVMQKKENERSREFSQQQQDDAQEFNAAEAQKQRDFNAAMQEDAQEFNSAEAALNRNFQAAEAVKNRNFQSAEAEAAFAREEEFYNKYQSIGAQMRQYREYGLNPALLAGGVSVGSTPSSPAAAGSSVTGATASSPLVSGAAASSSPLGAAMSAIPEIAGLAQIAASISKTRAEAKKIEKETSWIDDINTTNIENLRSMISERMSNIERNSAQINEISQGIKESVKRCSVMDSQIRVNDSVVDLNLSETQLNEFKQHVENLNAQSIQKMLPYIQARQEAEIALTNAKTNESKFMAEQLMYEANLKMLKGLVEADLISEGYYNNIVEQSGWDVRQAKRNYKWAPVNNLCTCFRDLCIGASALSNASTNVKSESRHGNSNAWLNTAVDEGLSYLLEGM